MDRLEFVRNQLNFLTKNVKDKIKAVTAAKVHSYITSYNSMVTFVSTKHYIYIL